MAAFQTVSPTAAWIASSASSSTLPVVLGGEDHHPRAPGLQVQARGQELLQRRLVDPVALQWHGASAVRRTAGIDARAATTANSTTCSRP